MVDDRKVASGPRLQDSIAVSVFVVILVESDKYRIRSKQQSDDETSRLVFRLPTKHISREGNNKWNIETRKSQKVKLELIIEVVNICLFPVSVGRMQREAGGK